MLEALLRLMLHPKQIIAKKHKAADSQNARTKSRLTQVPAKIGRPTKYSLEWAEQFCELPAQGQLVRQICSQPDQPHKTHNYIGGWKRTTTFATNTGARGEQTDHYVQENKATPETVSVALACG